MSMIPGQSLRRRLLIVEQNRHSFDELRDLLSALGHECEVTLDLDTALSILGERRIDLVVINAAICQMTDEKLIGALKAGSSRTALVIYNGTSNKARQRRLRRLGAAAYLSKSSNLKAVARAAQRVLEAMD